MRHIAAAVRALPFTFLIYLVEAALALIVALPIGLTLLDDGRASFAHAIGRAVWLDRTVELLPVLRVHSSTALLSAVLLVGLSPWLQMAWFSALAGPQSVGSALSQGAARYFRALTATALVCVFAALLLGPLVVAASVIERLLGEHPDARLHDLLLAAVAVPALSGLWLVHVLHDLSRARALSQGAWSAVRDSLRFAFRVRTQLSALVLTGSGLLVRVGALFVVQQRVVQGPLATLAVLQVSALLALLLRSVWLVSALACVDESSAARDLS